MGLMMDDKPIYHKNGLALEGYDVVSYFLNQPLKGSSIFSHNYQELEWRFANQQNLDLFVNNPAKYLPQYGGFCAFGAANGYKAKPKMSSYHVAEEKLYLNFSDYVQERWLQEKAEKIIMADQKWPATKSSKPISANRHWVYIRYKFLKLFGKDILE